MARHGELLVAPVSRHLTGQFCVRRLGDKPHLPVTRGLVHGLFAPFPFPQGDQFALDSVLDA